MRFKCIIFDCDGVLVDSETTTIGVIVEMAKEAGVEIDLEFAISEFSGQSLQYCFDFIEKKGDIQLPSDSVSKFRQLTFEAFKTDLKAIPGIHDLQKRLNCPRCVASNAPVNKLELNLGILNLLDYFEGNLFSAYDIQKWKPEPDLFLYAADKMGFLPKECVVIEDSLAGVTAAVAGGFEVYAYANSRTAKKLKAAGAKLFYDMNKLDSLLA